MPNNSGATFTVEHGAHSILITVIPRVSPPTILLTLVGLTAAGLFTLLSVSVISASLYEMLFSNLAPWPYIRGVFGGLASLADIPWLLLLLLASLTVAAGGYFIGVAGLAWQLEGSEAIGVTQNSITVTRKSGILRRRSIFHAPNITHLHAEDRDATGIYRLSFMPALSVNDPFTHGKIAFTHLGRSIRVGPTLNRDDARTLVEAILTKYPNYA